MSSCSKGPVVLVTLHGTLCHTGVNAGDCAATRASHACRFRNQTPLGASRGGDHGRRAHPRRIVRHGSGSGAGGRGGVLRRKLADAPRRVRALEERLLETKGQLAATTSQNERLTYTLREAREHISTLREEVDKLTQPPSAYGAIVGKNDDGTVDVLTSGRKMRVGLHPDIDVDSLERGAEVVLNDSFNVVLARNPEVHRRSRQHQGGARGRRARRSSSVAPTRSACASSPTPCAACTCAPATRCASTCAATCCSRSCPGRRSKTCCSRRCRTSPMPTSAASTARSSRSPTPSSCRSCTRSCSPSTSCRRRRASCCTARPVAARR